MEKKNEERKEEREVIESLGDRIRLVAMDMFD
jgi:hypothetical protein